MGGWKQVAEAPVVQSGESPIDGLAGGQASSVLAWLVGQERGFGSVVPQKLVIEREDVFPPVSTIAAPATAPAAPPTITRSPLVSLPLAL